MLLVTIVVLDSVVVKSKKKYLASFLMHYLFKENFSVIKLTQK